MENTEFKDAGIKAPAPLKEIPRRDKSKYCRFHISSGHNTEKKFQLKDAIEDQIKKGKLKRYIKDDYHKGGKKKYKDSNHKSSLSSESTKRKRSPS